MKEGSDIGFVPSPTKLEVLRMVNQLHGSASQSNKYPASSNLGSVQLVFIIINDNMILFYQILLLNYIHLKEVFIFLTRYFCF